jgi:hypothetical protein
MASSASYSFVVGNGTGTGASRSNLVFASGSTFQVTGSINIRNILVLEPTSSLPTGQPTGSFIVSGSGANCKPYFYNGATWTPLF